MRKRKRPSVCDVCEHFHEYEVCGVCCHIMLDDSNKIEHISASPSEILPGFLYLGSYDVTCHFQSIELLKTQGFSHVLNAVPFCRNNYDSAFTFYSLQDDKKLPFDDAVQFLEQCEKDKARVLVYCITGKNRSPAIVMAYLMKSKGWRLAQSYHLVKARRPFVEISQDVYQQLQDYERKIFGSSSTTNNSMPRLLPSFSFGF